jgi:hypothetical protein
METVTLITPTSDRPLVFALCERWMRRALCCLDNRPVHWIVADDGREPARCTLGQLHLRRSPAADPTASFRGNLRAALEQAAPGLVLFIEDDDWYAPSYLAAMIAWLSGDVEIAGEAESKYYNVRERRYLDCRNRGHASLCQTGIRGSLVPWLLEYLSAGRNANTPLVDLDLWNIGAQNSVRRLEPNSTLCVGIKGLPGKAGIGIGHRLGRRHEHDPHGTQLARWIGPADAALYFALPDLLTSDV